MQTADKIIRLTQDLALFTKKEKVKHKRNVSFIEASRIVRSYMRESSSASVTRRVDRTNDDNKYRTLVEKLIKLGTNDWPKFQEHLKNYARSNFTKHQISNKLEIGRDPML